MRSDSEIQRDVQAELNWSPEVDSTDIACKVKDSTVMLTGFVKTTLQKYRSERAARRVKGVAAVANDIQVRWPGAAPTDPEIARAAVALLRNNLPSAAQGIRAMVHEARITLLGEVERQHQRELAEQLMRRIEGVVSVRNSLRINTKIADHADIKARIKSAFRRMADVDSRRIAVEAAGPQITLPGEARSRAERNRTGATAAAAPCVTGVANQLTVRS